MCLPKYCWVCCWNISVDSGAKFFSIFRMMVAIFQIVSIIESMITSRVQLEFEYAVRETNIKDIFKAMGMDDDDVQQGNEVAEEIKQMIFAAAMLLLASSLLYAIIELIVTSLAIHGMRRARPGMLLPYIIWTSFLALIAFAFVALLVAIFTFVMIFINEIKADNPKMQDVPISLVIVIFVIFGITFGLVFAWILWDLLIMSSRHRQLKNSIGMDHIMLQEVGPNDEKEKMLYPQLT